MIPKHTNPKVSVALCTYNGSAFISMQLESILNQTYAPFEIVIVDDCSTDNTMDILNDFAKRYPCISLYRNESNIGYNKNFEKAMCLATGDLIAISDQDDIWHPKKIETLIDNWKEDTLLIYCDSVHFKNEVPKIPKSNKLLKKISGHNPRNLSIFNPVSGHAILFKKELLSLALPFDKQVYYDWWLAMVALVNGGISYVPEILVFQRVHHANVTVKVYPNKDLEFIEIKKMLVSHLSKFRSIVNLPKHHEDFFMQLYFLWSQSMVKGYNWKLFFFLMKYRKEVFAFKNRRVGFFSHLKHSYRYAFKRVNL